MAIIELAPAEIDTVSGGKKKDQPSFSLKVKGLPPKEVVGTMKIPFGPSSEPTPPPPPPTLKEQTDKLREKNDLYSGRG